MLYEQSMDVLSRVEQLKLATQQIGRGQRSVLSIGIVPSVLYGGLPALVRRVRQERPDLEFQLVEMMSLQQMEALRNGRIDIGFGRIQANLLDITRVVLREERLVLACPVGSPYANEPITTPLPLSVVSDHRLIVYPKVPRPSFADQVLGLLRDHDVQPREIQEVSELQTALGMVAAEVGLCIVPASTRVVRTDVHYRLFEEPKAVTPVIMSYRANDASGIPELLLRLLRDIGADHPAWLKYSHDRLAGPGADEA
jgi:DNA-binding transcriptional LysR family regulator